MKYQGCLVSFLFTLTLLGCGGGGGGGSDAAPANVNTPNPEPSEELQTGVFTDAPVTGLRYTQGRREGYTESGRFTYNARSSDPVCFFVGEVRLGCVAGGDVVTPYHLSSPGQPAGLQSGYNISRLLISLDESTGPEITLPTETRRARGYINFALSDGLFATDSVVNDLIERYAPEGSLSSREDVDVHIANNADVQQSIQALTQALDSEISSISIRWNSTLSEAGVLAHIEARSGGEPQQTEHLYLEVSQSNTQLYLSNLTYIDPNGEYTQVRVGRNGQPTRIADRDQVQAYLNLINTPVGGWFATSSYQPERSGNLIGNSGLQSRVETRYVTEQMANEVVEMASELGRQELSPSNFLRMASYAAALVQSIECAGSVDDTCGSKLQEALLMAQVNTGYESRILNWVSDDLSPDLCLPLQGVPASENCGFAPNLQEFNVVMSNRISEFSGVRIPAWADSDTIFFRTAPFILHDWVGDVQVAFGFSCNVSRSYYQFADGGYYGQVKGENVVCTEERLEVLNYNIYACGIESIVCNDPSSDYSFGLDMPSDWPGFSAKRNLAFRVAERMLSSGYGAEMSYLGTRDFRGSRRRFYGDPRLPESWSQFSSYSAWFESLPFDRSAEDFFASGVFIYNDFVEPPPFSIGVSIVEDTNELYNVLDHGFMNFMDRDGTEIMLRIMFW